MSLTPLPLSHYTHPPPKKLHFWHIFFALPAMNDPLPAEHNITIAGEIMSEH